MYFGSFISIKKLVMVHGGSDSPVEEILPLEALEAAIQRKNGKGGVFMPHECLTLTESIKIFSLGVAQGPDLNFK